MRQLPGCGRSGAGGAQSCPADTGAAGAPGTRPESPSSAGHRAAGGEGQDVPRGHERRCSPGDPQVAPSPGGLAADPLEAPGDGEPRSGAEHGKARSTGGSGSSRGRGAAWRGRRPPALARRPPLAASCSLPGARCPLPGARRLCRKRAMLPCRSGDRPLGLPRILRGAPSPPRPSRPPPTPSRRSRVPPLPERVPRWRCRRWRRRRFRRRASPGAVVQHRWARMGASSGTPVPVPSRPRPLRWRQAKRCAANGCHQRGQTGSKPNKCPRCPSLPSPVCATRRPPAARQRSWFGGKTEVFYRRINPVFTSLGGRRGVPWSRLVWGWMQAVLGCERLHLSACAGASPRSHVLVFHGARRV